MREWRIKEYIEHWQCESDDGWAISWVGLDAMLSLLVYLRLGYGLGEASTQEVKPILGELLGIIDTVIDRPNGVDVAHQLNVYRVGSEPANSESNLMEYYTGVPYTEDDVIEGTVMSQGREVIVYGG